MRHRGAEDYASEEKPRLGFCQFQLSSLTFACCVSGNAGCGRIEVIAFTPGRSLRLGFGLLLLFALAFVLVSHGHSLERKRVGVNPPHAVGEVFVLSRGTELSDACASIR